MLIAEIHGKSLENARSNEDYLTSAVFGHLQYVPPQWFWEDLLDRAKGLPDVQGREQSLAGTLAAQGFSLLAHSRLHVHFWPSHPKLGEPDLILVFTGGPGPPLALLIEAKLRAEKSSTGENDQLVRYLRALDDWAALRLSTALPQEPAGYLVYLTPRDSLTEVEDSATRLAEPDRDRRRLFRLRWQDVLAAAEKTAPTSPEPTHMILENVVKFLRRLGLEYFGGLTRLEGLSTLNPRPAAFSMASGSGATQGSATQTCRNAVSGFAGFNECATLDWVEVHRGGWVQ